MKLTLWNSNVLKSWFAIRTEIGCVSKLIERLFAISWYPDSSFYLFFIFLMCSSENMVPQIVYSNILVQVELSNSN